ncbi:MAG: hypothetical protein FWG09_02640 [Synergistaceae bacterium]|nr:hypothetical protein [Synergistaceae bacterium]
MNNRKSDVLNTLSFNSTLGETIRILYIVALDHCVLRSLDREKIIGLSKDQLVALLERGYSESKVEELFELAEKRAFKPLDPERSAAELAEVSVLTISEDYGEIMKFAEAVSAPEPKYPSWWEIPLPLAILLKGKIIINDAANNLSISKSLLHIKTNSLPSKQKEFFVTLKDNKKSHSVLFKQLGRRIYLIDDVTQDVETAGDIVWWASVGKAYASKIESEGKTMRRDDEDIGPFDSEEEISCEWDGKNIGKLCIGRKIDVSGKVPKKNRKK